METDAAISHPPVSMRERLRALNGARVLVTGGAGFVGSNLAARLVALGSKVVVLDDLSTGRRELLARGMSDFVEGSVTDARLVGRLVEDVEFVFHLAVRNIILSTRQVREDGEVNIGGTLNVLLAAASRQSPPRIVYTSSASIYGNPRGLPISEEDGISILNPYAASKFAGESYCSAFHEMYQLPIAVVRYSNVYGVHQSPLNPYCGVISRFFVACMSGAPMTVHGSGLQTRDFTYVDDAIEATLLASVTPRAEGEVFNVGSGCETSVRELARQIAGTAGVEPVVEYVDRRDIDNVQRRVMSIERARRILRWVPSTPLDAGLKHTYEWLRGADHVNGGMPAGG